MAFGSLVDHAERLGLRSIAASQATGLCALCDQTTIRLNGTWQCLISSSVDFQIEWNGVIDLAQSSSVLLQRLAVMGRRQMRIGKDRRWGDLS
jgi:hypothetical protein